MTKKAKVTELLPILQTLYPYDHVCFLDYDKNRPWQLLIATILSAQCTDERVNKVTLKLFAKYPTLEDFALADFEILSQDVRSTGFFRMKAQHIIDSAKIIVTQYNGDLPSDIDVLTALPGVGRKTANVVRGHIFKIPSVVVDTHVKRVSTKLGLVKSPDPVKIEFELMKTLPKEHWIAYNQQIISHGRKVCIARNPKCSECTLSHLCKHYATIN